jgi:hypothetical protein
MLLVSTHIYSCVCLFPLFNIDTLGFLARYRLSERLIELKVPEKLLDVACHDTHVTVQEFALRVLKQMLKHEQAKEVISILIYFQFSPFFRFSENVMQPINYRIYFRIYVHKSKIINIVK